MCDKCKAGIDPNEFGDKQMRGPTIMFALFVTALVLWAVFGR